jgi:hypothetical protein
MGSRYGRNKRREHREEIAKLQSLLFGQWARLQPDTPALENYSVIEVVDERRRSPRYGEAKEARVTLAISDPKEMARLHDIYRSGHVAFDGFEWIVAGMDMAQLSIGERGLSMPEVTISLRGIRRG